MCRPHAFQLRDYQRNAISAVCKAIGRGVKRPAVVLATGGGKTVVFSHLIPQIQSADLRRRKTLVLAHKQELVFQNAAMIRRVNPNLTVNVDMAAEKPSADADIIVGSVMTLVRMSRLEKYNPLEFKTIILDECHHASAGSWIKILEYFKADSQDTEVCVVGFTATMERSDDKSLGTVFDEIVFERGLIEMVDNKELSDVKFVTLEADIGLDSVKTYNGDYAINNLELRMLDEDVMIKIACSYLLLRKQYDFKSTLIFCTSIAHCKTLCGVLQSSGVNAQYVTGETVTHERKAIVQDFRDGKIDALCNVMVFTEGTDIPNIDSVFLARPTKLRALLVQMIGRGLRLHEGKLHCYVVDVVDTRGPGFLSVLTLFDLPPSHDVNGKSYKQLRQEAEIDVNEARQAAIVEEMKRLLLEQDAADTVGDVFLDEPGYAVKHQIFDGFKRVNAFDVAQFAEFANVTSAIRSSSMKWARITYNTWASQIDYTQFFQLSEIKSAGPNIYTLGIYSFLSHAQLQASKYKCKRVNHLSTVIESENLNTVLAKAESRFNASPMAAKLRSLRHVLKPTSNQITTLETMVGKKIKAMSKLDPASTQQAIQVASDRLQSLLREKCSEMMFAAKVTTDALAFIWGINNLIKKDKQ